MNLVQKEFARKDYKGLDKESKKYLREQRNKIARQLNSDRKVNNIALEFERNHIKKYKNPGISDTDLLNNRNFDHNRYLKWSKEEKNYFLNKAKELNKQNKKKNKKLAIGAAVASGVAGLVYGGKKVYDYYKNKNNK